MAASAQSEPRVPLSRERVLRAATALADASGVEALTMRRLAQDLGVEAMSLYHHVANKEEILDGIVDAVVAEIIDEAGTVGPADTWKETMRARILAARRVMLRHPWAPRVIESRVNMSVSMVQYFDTMLATFRQGGFSYDLAHHALHALGSRALGFTQELFDPGADTAAGEATEAAFAQVAANAPHLVEMLAEIAHDGPDLTLGWCDDQTEFEFGLDLLLDGLDRSVADAEP